jgi:DNA-directed RNA polymerase subunit RPC12/RpoP
MDKPIVKYVCRKCGKQFDAPQGSRRYLCPLCVAEAVQSGKKAG